MNPATKDVIVSRMMQVKGGCKLTDTDIDVLTVGGISEPKTLVVVEPEPGVLEFKTEGGTTELQNSIQPHLTPVQAYIIQ